MSDANPWPQFTPGEAPLETLVKLSNFYGANLGFVIAGGGNTSYKDEGSLFVKASGTELGAIQKDGFVELRRAELEDLLHRQLSEDVATREEEHKNAVLASRVNPDLGQRPSVEALMHHAIPGRFVVHTHATELNQLTCSAGGEELARELYGDGIVWIPFVDPGYVLSRTINESMAAWREKTGKSGPRAILMQNHGLIVAGDTPEAIRENTDWLFEKIRARKPGDVKPGDALLPAEERAAFAEALKPMLAQALAEGGKPRTINFADTGAAADFMSINEAQAIAAGGPLTPDQIVYCKSFPLWFEPVAGEAVEAMKARLVKAIAEHTEATRFAPKVILVDGVGLFAAGGSERAAMIVELVYTDAIKVMLGARALGGVNYMSKRDREFIDNWEVEAYRRKVAAKG